MKGDTVDNLGSHLVDVVCVGARVGMANTRSLNSVGAIAAQIFSWYLNTQGNHDGSGRNGNKRAISVKKRKCIRKAM